jgi:hypothetical protein
MRGSGVRVIQHNQNEKQQETNKQNKSAERQQQSISLSVTQAEGKKKHTNWLCAVYHGEEALSARLSRTHKQRSATAVIVG